MEKTKIDWCDSSWNPVTGCLHSCKYCYARSIANRFSGGGEKWTDDALIELNDRIYFDESEKAEAYPYGFKPTLHRIRNPMTKKICHRAYKNIPSALFFVFIKPVSM